MSEYTITYYSEGNKYIKYKHGKRKVKKTIDKRKDIVNNIKYKKLSFSSDISTNPTFKALLIIANDILEYAKCWDHHSLKGLQS